MSRSVSLAAIVVTAAVSYGLYHLSYEVAQLEEELIDFNRALLRDRESIQVLQAEWSYLTRPEALQERANRNLQLQPVLPRQIATIDQVPTPEQIAQLPAPRTAPSKPVAASPNVQPAAQAPQPRKPAPAPTAEQREALAPAPARQDALPPGYRPSKSAIADAPFPIPPHSSSQAPLAHAGAAPKTGLPVLPSPSASAPPSFYPPAPAAQPRRLAPEIEPTLATIKARP